MRRCLLDPAMAKSLANRGYLRLGLLVYTRRANSFSQLCPKKEVQTSAQTCPKYMELKIARLDRQQDA